MNDWHISVRGCFLTLCLSTLAASYLIFILNNNHFGRSNKPQQPVSDSLSTFNDIIDSINLNCKEIIRGNKNAVRKAKQWVYNTESIEELIFLAENRCLAIKQLFKFTSNNITQEELEYPLAYGAVVYKNFVQVMFMLSAFYRPHNEYCMAVSGSASRLFKYFMIQLDKCFGNIHVLIRPPISWGSFEIINSTWACVQYLTLSKTPWKYYQQLSGVDIPLKTNLEMVKIFKQWNDTVNSEFETTDTFRLNGKRMKDSPLPLFKSSLSAAVPRKSIEWILKSDMASKLLKFLKGTYVPDEAFWTTLTGNIRDFPVPGGLNAEEWKQFRNKYRAHHRKQVDQYVSSKTNGTMNYFLARHQIWHRNCGGKIVSESCVFGVDDLANVLRQPHLIAHKMYLDFQPAAFFCALKELRLREMRPISLNITVYGEIPQVELSSGVPYEKLKHHLWMF